MNRQRPLVQVIADRIRSTAACARNAEGRMPKEEKMNEEKKRVEAERKRVEAERKRRRDHEDDWDEIDETYPNEDPVEWPHG